VKYHTVNPDKQRAYQIEIGRFFGRLSPPLFRQALNVRNTITSLDGAQSGSWKDILSAENDKALPWLTTHRWLLNDRQYPAEAERDKLEKYLYLGMFFTYLATWLNEAILDPDTIFHISYQQLVETLQEAAQQQFRELIPPSSPFWQDYRRIQSDYDAAINWRSEWQLSANTDFTTADWQHYANGLAPIKTAITAAAYLTERPHDLPALWQIIDLTNQAVRIRQDILALRRDVGRGHLTYPTMRTMALAGLPVKRPFNPEQIIGAAILTGSIKKVCAEAAARLEQSRPIAAELSLPGWSTYCDQLEQSLNDIQSLFSLKKKDDQSQKLTFLPYRDPLSQSLKMAAAYLSADPMFSESIEINRGGLAGLDEATGVIFPFSFITYLLLENGHPLADHVDLIFQKMDTLGYRYYENMAVAPDADEVAILLRLFKYSQNQEEHRRQLEKPLQWLAANVLPDGRIPAFWEKVDVPVLKRMVVWESYCLTAEINTLLGLTAYDWPRFQPLIEKSAAGLFGRYLESDFGAVAYYDLLYTLWQAIALVRQLEAKTAGSHLSALIRAAGEKLARRLDFVAQNEDHTPQQAAFLVLACLEHQSNTILNPSWITSLQKTQRYDGSWGNEPFYITCDRDGLPGNWYSSHSMTTAFCYHALNTYNRWQNRP
jgi:hypothetical protein